MGNIASNTVNQMAFCPPPATYRKEDVNMWLDNDKGNRLPAFHIRKGHPLTILVSHANAEDLGIVLGFWSSADGVSRSSTPALCFSFAAPTLRSGCGGL